MIIQVEMWHIVTFALTVVPMLIGAFWTLIVIVVKQFEKRLDERFQAQETNRTAATIEWNRRFDEMTKAWGRLFGLHRELEKRFSDHLAKMPLDYQRREDAIRQEVGIIARLDGLAELVEMRHRDMDQKIEGLRGS